MSIDVSKDDFKWAASMLGLSLIVYFVMWTLFYYAAHPEIHLGGGLGMLIGFLPLMWIGLVSVFLAMSIQWFSDVINYSFNKKEKGVEVRQK